MAVAPAYSSAWTITADGYIFGQAGLPGEGGTVATGVLFRDRQVAVSHCDLPMFRQCTRLVTAVYDVSEPVPSPGPGLVGGFRDLAGEIGPNLPLEFVYGSKFPRMATPLGHLIAYGNSYVFYRADIDNWQALIACDGCGRGIATERHHFLSSLGPGPMWAIGVVRDIFPPFFYGAMGDISTVRLGVGDNPESSWTHAVMDVNSHFQIVGGRNVAGEAHATVTDGYLRLVGRGPGADTPTVDLNAAATLPAGLTRLNAANGINERGWIVGSGFGSPGCGTACTTPSAAFVLIPTPETPSWAPPGAPLGHIDTPTAGAVTTGEVAFTGWAVDNSGLAGVDVYRAPVPGELTALHDLVFVGMR